MPLGNSSSTRKGQRIHMRKITLRITIRANRLNTESTAATASHYTGTGRVLITIPKK